MAASRAMKFPLASQRVVILSITDLNMLLPMALARRKDTLPSLARFIADVSRFANVQALNKR